MALDPKAISAAAFLIGEQARSVGRGWEQQGIHAAVRGALLDDKRDLLAVIIAGFEAVADPKANTPAALRWSDRYKATKGSSDWMNNYGPECKTCGKSRRHHDSAESKVPPERRHPFEITATGEAAA